MRLQPISALVAARASCPIFTSLASGETVEHKTAAHPQATLYDTEVRSLASTFVEQEYRLFVGLKRSTARRR